MMNRLKKQIFFILFFIPVFLIGAESEPSVGCWRLTDKKGASLILEWHKVLDIGSFCTLMEKQIAPVEAAAFADQVKDFLLDDRHSVKPEYVDYFSNLSDDERKDIECEIKLAGAAQDERVALRRALFLKELTKAKIGCTEQELLITSFVIMVKNSMGDVLGFSIFHQPTSFKKDSIYLGLLAVEPRAQERGLAKVLIFSILKLMPLISHITLDTQIWNTRAQMVYKKLGFLEVERDKESVTFEWGMRK